MKALELRVPPLLLTAALLAVQVPTVAAFPAGNLAYPGAPLLAGLLAAAGLIFLFGAALQFRLSRTTLNPLSPQKASALVTGGIYALSRNPQYLGMALLLAAPAAWCGSLPGALAPAAFCAWITRFQILPEERAMRERFGAEFAAYAARVRRWA